MPKRFTVMPIFSMVLACFAEPDERFSVFALPGFIAGFGFDQPAAAGTAKAAGIDSFRF
jgi:hypothetical protein